MSTASWIIIITFALLLTLFIAAVRPTGELIVKMNRDWDGYHNTAVKINSEYSPVSDFIRNDFPKYRDTLNEFCTNKGYPIDIKKGDVFSKTFTSLGKQTIDVPARDIDINIFPVDCEKR
jgi:hypothetical protein